MKSNIQVIYKFGLLAIILVALNFIYKYTFYESDLVKHSDVIENVRQVPQNTDILYIGESSNTTASENDIDKRSISGITQDFFPALHVHDITKPASHAGIYMELINNIPIDHKISTLIVTLNLRSFNAQWIYSRQETSLQKSLVLIKRFPPLVNRFLLSFKAYEIKSDAERTLQFKEKWENDILKFPYPFPHKNVTEWDYHQATVGVKDENGERDKAKTILACHYIKAYAFQIDTVHHVRLDDFNDIIDFAKDRGWNIVFNLLAENTDKAQQLVGDDLIYLMEENRIKLTKYFEDRGAIVIDNLYAVEDMQFIDQNWTTEHYAERGRKTIAKNMAEGIKHLYPGHYKTPDFIQNAPSTFFTDCESKSFWGQYQTISTEKAFSGKQSSKIGNGIEYGITFEYPYTEIPRSKRKEIDIHMKIFSTSNQLQDIKLVIEAKGRNMKSYWNSVSLSSLLQKTNEWETVNYTYNIPSDFINAEHLKIYIYNPSPSILYIDDLKIDFR